MYWGGRELQDLYMDAQCRAWAASLAGFRYVPLLSSRPLPDDWRGASGYVHDAVATDFPDLSGHQVYACGSPSMIESARRDLVQLYGLPEAEFHADPF